MSPANFRRIGSVDDRYQAYNVEMVEVIGGRFWKPYSGPVDPLSRDRDAAEPGSNPVGMDPSMFQYRPPIDLSNPRLRKLAAALGPAYVRVSGTWANTAYFQDSEGPAPKTAPKGFTGVLTRRQWKGVVDFAHAVNVKIVTSVATSAGTRDAAGVWTPRVAREFFAYNKSIGGEIAATEFMNEPSIAEMGGAPKGYNAAAFARDIAVFRPFLREAAPGTLLAGPGSVGEGATFVPPMALIKSEDMLAATGPVFDVFSYHFYGAASSRCASMMPKGVTTAAEALSEEWLSRTESTEAFYASLRDKFDPGKPLWITETAQAACGGDLWASTYIDTFRYLDQLGRLAKKGVQVIAHNTLASSDYGLLDQNTLAPRPNYWAALLWRKLMGTTVLQAAASPDSRLHLYAHCLRNTPGGVALLAINADRSVAHAINLAAAAERYTLTAPVLLDTAVLLNDHELRLEDDGNAPPLAGVATPGGRLTLAPASIAFLAFPDANNAACR